MNIYQILFCGLCLLFFFSCKTSNKKTEVSTDVSEADKDRMIREQFVKANQSIAQKEIDEMDYYTKTHQMPFIKTLSGIRYYVYKASAKGDSIKPGMQVTMDYRLNLLDGTECYSSVTEGPKTFIVGQDDIESGIHKGIQFLKTGDKAILLIPSVLAHGLLGDMNKIPPQMPIVYDVQIH